MPTECTPKLFAFEAVARRAVVASFDGGDITSNGGALLLGQVDRGRGLIRRFAACEAFGERAQAGFRHRWYEIVEHGALTKQGVGALFGGIGLEITVVTKGLSSGSKQS